MAAGFTPTEARRFYDRFGAKQDNQGHYEDAALKALIHRARFAEAEAVLELGCGTGRLAARLLADDLPASTRYLGLDISPTMVGLARDRLQPWGERAEVRQCGETLDAGGLPGPFDRVVAAYVFDLFEAEAIARTLDALRSVTRTGGLLCTAGLTPGRGPLPALTSGLWALVRRIKPSLVGGCRPLTLQTHLRPEQWRLRHREVVVSAAVPSEIVIAEAV